MANPQVSRVLNDPRFVRLIRSRPRHPGRFEMSIMLDGVLHEVHHEHWAECFREAARLLDADGEGA